jgi:long-subunit acyl-CoA synthetase (AMP-forming)
MRDEVTPDWVQGAASMCDVFQATVAAQPEVIALQASDGSASLTWGEYGERVRRVASGLAAIGTRRGDSVALMVSNRPEFSIIDTAATHLGAVPFSIYNTSTPEQIAYFFSNARNRVVVCEAQFVDRIRQAADLMASPTVEQIIVLDGEGGTMGLDELEATGHPDFDFEGAWRAVTGDDLITLIYTSGTTGAPKGVEITHANIQFSVAAILNVAEVLTGNSPQASVLSFLPDAHLANRWFGLYVPMASGATVTTVRDGKTVGTALKDYEPTMFLGVPMLWYKFKAAIEQLLAAEPEERRQLVDQALRTGFEVTRRRTSGADVPPALLHQFVEADRLVLAGLRERLGLRNVTAAMSGGAPIAKDTLEFFMAIGLPICEGWAMSECSAAGIMDRPNAIRAGTVGFPMPGVELRLADDGELLVRGPGVMRGYRNDPDRTAEAIDADGWLATGDIATIDADGYVSIVDRKKELIINSSGKNMSPANIENVVKTSSSLIGSVVATGDGRPHVVALVTLDPDTAGSFAASHGLTDASPTALAADPKLLAAVQAEIDAANTKLSRVEQVRAFRVLPIYWEPSSDELTPTMKLRRRVIERKYAAVIDELYVKREAPNPAAV